MTRGYRRGPVIPEQKETINGLMLGATQRRSAIPSGRMVTKGYGCVSTSTGGDAPTHPERSWANERSPSWRSKGRRQAVAEQKPPHHVAPEKEVEDQAPSGTTGV